MSVWLSGSQAGQMRAEGMIVARRFSPAAFTFAKSKGILTYTPEDLEGALFDFGPYLSRLMRGFEESELARTYVPQRVFLESAPDRCEGEDLLAHAMDWASGDGRKLWLLLGDYGTGKTSFFKRFAYELAKAHREKAAEKRPAPIPLAINLKDFPNAFTLKGLIQEHLRENADWHGNPDILLHLLETGRVVLLLDAFDEMGTAAAGRSVEDQFRMLAKPTQEAMSKNGNRVLITCRTHFFRDQQFVKDVCHGNADGLIHRDSALGRVARSFNAAIDELLLFNSGQIRKFLEGHLPAAEVKKAESFIQNTYDLPSLAPRPVLLEMIVKSLPELMAAGTGLTPAGLYHRYTSHWLSDKSGGSLQTTPDQRKLLLERLAFELWARPQNRIHHRKLIAVLETLPNGHLAGLDTDRVDLELRTAAFLTRNAEGYYGFSHRSFLEFFFARYLLRLIRHADPADALKTAPITPECFLFLSDLLETEEDNQALYTHLRGILEKPYRSAISENALRLYYHMTVRQKRDWVIKGPIRLEGANLQGEAFPNIPLSGARLDDARLTRIDLSGADISKVSCKNAEMTDAILTGVRAVSADFSGATLIRANCRKADFASARFASADLTVAVLVDSNCQRADFSKSNCTAARFAGALLKGAKWNQANRDRITAPGAKPCFSAREYPESTVPFLQLGHYGPVNSAVFSKDGTRILTAGSDGTAKIWDVRTAKPLLTLVLIRGGWLSIDSKGRYRAGGKGTACLSYRDAAATAFPPTLWHPEDLPEMAQPDE
jgi:hypothetical protein